MLRPGVPSETTLTEEFCALMDASTQRLEKSLLFEIDALTTALALNGSVVDIDLSIETLKHSASMEAYVSQADFGLVLEYRHAVLPAHDWSAAYHAGKEVVADKKGLFGAFSIQQC